MINGNDNAVPVTIQTPCDKLGNIDLEVLSKVEREFSTICKSLSLTSLCRKKL